MVDVQAVPASRTGARGAAARTGLRGGVLFWLAACFSVFYLLVAVFGPLIIQYDGVGTNIGDRLLPPLSTTTTGATAWFGTDQVGRDLLAQVVQGARVSLLVATGTILIGGGVGLLLGMVAGYFGGVIDTVIMRLADIQLAFPGILLAILLAAVLGPSLLNVIVVLAVLRWVVFARLVRGSTLGTRGREFVDSARVLGVGTPRILRRYILPAVLTPFIVTATVQVGLMIVAEASLSFLGLGVPPSTASWGTTIANGREYLSTAWWIATLPGVVLALVVLSLGILGDQLRDRLDPKLRS
ncbi:ABC transporter permease [Pseudonocardia sp. MH-G8]|uniref:ABC transporter permease n=1 Tax=Pseudonocardia sp. MH-G8 TaxID=1854588 RepID=UPI000BA081E0|nr:ABC transporter permease [Pseudonocardia sp. MH-G8]OZM77141.1 peptide ABC transporter permease [Pseudonocardia sp. MH-G8]